LQAPRIVPLGSYDSDARAEHETSVTAFISLLPNQIIAAMFVLTILGAKLLIAVLNSTRAPKTVQSTTWKKVGPTVTVGPSNSKGMQKNTARS